MVARPRMTRCRWILLAGHEAAGIAVVRVGKQLRVPRCELEGLLGSPITWPLPTVDVAHGTESNARSSTVSGMRSVAGGAITNWSYRRSSAAKSRTVNPVVFACRCSSSSSYASNPWASPPRRTGCPRCRSAPPIGSHAGVVAEGRQRSTAWQLPRGGTRKGQDVIGRAGEHAEQRGLRKVTTAV